MDPENADKSRDEEKLRKSGSKGVHAGMGKESSGRDSAMAVSRRP